MKLSTITAAVEKLVETATYFVGMVLIGLAIAGGLWTAYEKGILGPAIAALFIVGIITGKKNDH